MSVNHQVLTKPSGLLFVIKAFAVFGLVLAFAAQFGRESPIAPASVEENATPASETARPTASTIAQPVALPARPLESAPLSEEPSVKLLQLIAARSRWQAERDGRERMTLPARFVRLSTLAPSIASGEQRLLDVRRAAFESLQRDLKLKMDIVRDEIAGYELQREAKTAEMALFQEELRTVSMMHSRQLANLPRVLSLKRDLARMRWDIGSLNSSVARSRLAIKEIEQQLHEAQHRQIVDSEHQIRDLDLEIGTITKSPEDLPAPLVALAAETQNRRRE